jgi:hypothetical protein
VGRKGGVRGQGGEKAQTMYAHVNKRKKFFNAFHCVLFLHRYDMCVCIDIYAYIFFLILRFELRASGFLGSGRGRYCTT